MRFWILDGASAGGRSSWQLSSRGAAAAAAAREEAELGSDGAWWSVGWLGLRKDLRSGRGV